MSDTMTLIIDGIPHELPLITGTEGERAVGISRLCPTTGLIVLSDAYSNTGSYSLVITFIDGEHGILRYRGVPIKDLASRSSFIEVMELLIFGDPPGDDERDEFRQLLTENSALHCDMRRYFDDFPVDAYPMAILPTMTNTTQVYDLPEIHIAGEAGFRRAAVLFLVKTRIIAAASYKSHIGQPIVHPHCDLSYVENFLHMMFTVPYQDYEATPGTAHALNTFFVPHADREQNYSTSMARMVASSNANLFITVSAGVAALWGPLHGGADVGVIKMLEQIHSRGISVSLYLTKAKNRKFEVRLMGFGHRVYHNFDPCARALRKAVHDLLESMNIDDPLLDIAREAEETVLADDYSAERRPYPNVDFYSGIILWAIGIPLDMSTVLFAVGRTAGWTVHWKEVSDDPAQRIYRLRQLYTGNKLAKQLPLDER